MSEFAVVMTTTTMMMVVVVMVVVVTVVVVVVVKMMVKMAMVTVIRALGGCQVARVHSSGPEPPQHTFRSPRGPRDMAVLSYAQCLGR